MLFHFRAVWSLELSILLLRNPSPHSPPQTRPPCLLTHGPLLLHPLRRRHRWSNISSRAGAAPTATAAILAKPLRRTASALTPPLRRRYHSSSCAAGPQHQRALPCLPRHGQNDLLLRPAHAASCLASSRAPRRSTPRPTSYEDDSTERAPRIRPTAGPVAHGAVPGSYHVTTRSLLLGRTPAGRAPNNLSCSPVP